MNDFGLLASYRLRRSERDARMRRWSYAAALVLPLFYCTGVYAFWPIIVPEFARRDLWEVVMGGAEDVVAGFWYLRFVLAPVLGMLGWGHGLLPATRAVSQWWHVGISMLCGAALSVVSMGLTLHTEMSAYKSASRTVADTRVVKRIRFSRIVHYRLECHFKDALGAEHVFGITAVDEPGRPPVGYPAEVVRKLGTARRSCRSRSGMTRESQTGLGWRGRGALTTMPRCLLPSGCWHFN